MDEKKDVKKEETTSAPVQEQKEEAAEVSEDVKTPEVVDKSVYEKVREAMKAEREAKRAEKAKVAELEERLAKFEQSQKAEEDFEYDPYKAKTDILFMMNKDPFVKDNLDLIEERMATEKLDIQSAVKEIKAEYFDRIQKEGASAEVNKPLKQEKPTATEEEVQRKKPEESTDILKDALAGKIDIDPLQLEAIKRALGRK